MKCGGLSKNSEMPNQLIYHNVPLKKLPYFKASPLLLRQALLLRQDFNRSRWMRSDQGVGM